MSSPSDRLAQLEAELTELKGQMQPSTPRAGRRKSLARRFVILAAGLALLIPAGVVLAGGQTFNDVPPSHKFYNDIEAVAATGVTFGCGNGSNYCPNGLVTRGQMAAFLNRLGALGPGKSPKANATRLDGLDSSAFARPLYAVVNANGTLARGVGASSVAHGAGSGVYVVHFNRNVRDCAYTATIGLAGASGTSSRGFIAVVGAAASVNAVWVNTDDIAGAAAERGFHLNVLCAGQTGGTAAILELGQTFTPPGATTSGENVR